MAVSLPDITSRQVLKLVLKQWQIITTMQIIVEKKMHISITKMFEEENLVLL